MKSIELRMGEIFEEQCFCSDNRNKGNCSDFYKESNRMFGLELSLFLQTNFDFLTSHYRQNFFISFKKYCCLELKLEQIYHL